MSNKTPLTNWNKEIIIIKVKKRYDIQRVKLGDLEKEVKRRNLKWKRIDNGGDLNIV